MKKSHKAPSKKKERRSVTREHVKKGLVAGGTVTLATVGCSGCNDGGAVDPPPSPLVCGDIQAGQFYEATGSRADSLLNVNIQNFGPGDWEAVPEVRDLEGLILLEAKLRYEHSLDLQFKLATDSTSTGKFTIYGSLHGALGDSCTVARRFTVNIYEGTVVIAEARDGVPLQNRNRARIEIIRQDGLQVLLRPLGALPDWKLVWSVTDGALEQVAEGVLWKLPSRPGLYQLELLTDHGTEGFALDVLPLEVGGTGPV